MSLATILWDRGGETDILIGRAFDRLSCGMGGERVVETMEYTFWLGRFYRIIP
jgi:hypothetical protein